MVEMDGEVRDPAGGEHERRGFPMQVGEFGFELHDRVMGAGDVAGAAGPGAVGARGLNRGFDDVAMAAHAQIVVRAPDRDFAWGVLFAGRAPERHRKAARVALEVGERAVTLFGLQAVDRVLESPLIIHFRSCLATRV